MLLDFKSFTTFMGGSGCEAMVPQFTPIASEIEAMLKMVKKKKVNVMKEETVDIVEVSLGFFLGNCKMFGCSCGTFVGVLSFVLFENVVSSVFEFINVINFCIRLRVYHKIFMGKRG